MSSPCEGPVQAYRGLASYRDCDADRKLFFGRAQEKQELLSLVLSSGLVVLFSRSGLGKTSLLNVALLEPLRERGFFPVVVRLTQDPIGGPVESVYACLREAADLQGLTPSRFQGEGTLWEYFFDGSFSIPSESKPRRVILIFDQFEELFNIVARHPTSGQAWVETFIRELSDLVRGRVPEALQAKMAHLLETANPEHPQWERAMTLVYKGGAPDVKVVLSIREESLANLQVLKHAIPNIFDNALRLEPLSPEHAREAIVSPGQQADVLGDDTFSIEPQPLEAILAYCRRTRVGGRWITAGTIDPVQLQILCQYADEKRRRRKGKTITWKDLGGSRGIPRIFEACYRRLLSRLPRVRALWSGRGWYRPSLKNLILIHRPRAAGRTLCEKGLVTPTGDRNSLPASVIARRYGLLEKDLELLSRERLLESASRLGSQFYELSHDTLAGAVRRALWRRRGRYAAGVAAAVLLPIGCQQGTRYLDARPLRARAQDAREQRDVRREAVESLSSLGYIKGVRLRGADLSEIRLIEANFARADLTRADLSRAYCHHCSFVGAVLVGSDLTGARLAEADLRRATLQGANLEETDLTGADLRDAKLQDAKIEKADITDARFDGADLTGTPWWLAYGWRDKQVDSLRVRWPAANIEGTKPFQREYSRLTENIEKAGRNAESAALALNSRAWFRAIRGVRLDSAFRDITRALEVLPRADTAAVRYLRPYFLDTRGFIRLQQGGDDSASAADFDSVVTAMRKPSVPDQDLEREANYRFGLALCRLGKLDEARERFRIADSMAYRPSYELLLSPRKLECAPAAGDTP